MTEGTSARRDSNRIYKRASPVSAASDSSTDARQQRVRTVVTTQASGDIRLRFVPRTVYHRTDTK